MRKPGQVFSLSIFIIMLFTSCLDLDTAATSTNPGQAPKLTATPLLPAISTAAPYPPLGEIRFNAPNAARETNLIYSMNADGSSITELGRLTTEDNNLAWAKDGERVVFTHRSGYFEESLYLMNITDQSLMQLTSVDSLNTTPSWCLIDSQEHILYSSRSTVDVEEYIDEGWLWLQIMMLDLENLEVSQLTYDVAMPVYSVCSPDGYLVAFTSDNLDDVNFDLLNLLNIETGEIVPLILEKKWRISEPNWSPDGEHIVFSVVRVEIADGTHLVVHHDDADLYIIDKDGSNLRVFRDDDYYTSEPVWSPDGNYIAYSSKREDGLSTIYVMSVEGGEEIRLTDPQLNAENPHWFPAFE